MLLHGASSATRATSAGFHGASPTCLAGASAAALAPRGFEDALVNVYSIDWFKGKITGKSQFSWENLWFPVDFPLGQPIDLWMGSNDLMVTVGTSLKQRG